ncbi:hypothetical protein NN561_005462 [Cricetulus griseus]
MLPQHQQSQAQQPAITRILKSLGELGLEHYQAPLVRFFLEETLVQHQLPRVHQSVLGYIMFAVRCRHQRRELVYFAWEHFRPRCQFVWGPVTSCGGSGLMVYPGH